MEIENQLLEISLGSNTTSGNDEKKMNAISEKVRNLVAGKPVVVFTTSGCCMCHVVKQLLFSLGVSPTVVELDQEADGSDIQGFLSHIAGDGQKNQQNPVPAVFVGGKFLGGVETLMSCHINGSLVPLLKDAGALWL
ncbi:Glutaredoxin domain-containing protein [Heracleum sosnowskyi]|uniref:Glutaredoxin domain-containing protein n=1 Tax=Heracleum sosnowskyi TaxID=360622 RepID=A0AAD8MCW4_9APIA|nr:Glutaredoxin domain-containing protein [Heracleum sosnowskyi]